MFKLTFHTHSSLSFNATALPFNARILIAKRKMEKTHTHTHIHTHTHTHTLVHTRTLTHKKKKEKMIGEDRREDLCQLSSSLSVTPPTSQLQKFENSMTGWRWVGFGWGKHKRGDKNKKEGGKGKKL